MNTRALHIILNTYTEDTIFYGFPKRQRSTKKNRLILTNPTLNLGPGGPGGPGCPTGPIGPGRPASPPCPGRPGKPGEPVAPFKDKE